MGSYRSEYATDRLYFIETAFDSLMQTRIIEVLLVCSQYDRFVLEEDGRVEELLFQEYAALGLSYPPRFTFAGNSTTARDILPAKGFDLVIVMPGACGEQGLDFVQQLRELVPDIPVVFLLRSSSDHSLDPQAVAEAGALYTFHWLSSSQLLLAIVKLLEDRLNAEHDVNKIGVQTIILVEDSVRYYSKYLPLFYRMLFAQARALMQEGLNDHQKTLRMRGRPKILLATNYEQAIELYDRYRHNMLGIISDITYPRGGKVDPHAGLALCEYIRQRDPVLPILLQSSQVEHAASAASHGAEFVHKQSPRLLKKLREYISYHYGFGDFIFRMPDTAAEVGRAANLVELQRSIEAAPIESIIYHACNNHFSKWLKARALYTLAQLFRPRQPDDFDSHEGLREFLVDTIKNYRLHVGRGTVAHFDRDRFDNYSVFQRIGTGSLGGKARGVAFVNTLLKRNRIMFRFPEVVVQIPKTVVLTTEVFDDFMEQNQLYDIALGDQPDEKVLDAFLEAELPTGIEEDLITLLSVLGRPLAVRSSSVLEDSYLQPFAGVYATYFVPNNAPAIDTRLHDIRQAIKAVYASVFYRESKAYALSTGNKSEEEKMAVMVQDVTGAVYGDCYYPNISGVARSINHYPVGNERPEEGMVNLAIGLGKTVVEGEAALRFSPAHPRKILQLSSPRLAVRSTQRSLWAIDLSPRSFKVTTDPAFSLRRLSIDDAARYPANAALMSTYDHADQAIRDDPSRPGVKLVTFASVLKYGGLPLADILRLLLSTSTTEMNMPIELEFAVDLSGADGRPRAFKFLQIRPTAENEGPLDLDLATGAERAIITASTALGNGVTDGIHDVVYLRPQTFQPACTRDVVETIAGINDQLRQSGGHFVLIGPGRWGSSDPWLGVPLKWSQLTQARVIVEASQPNFTADPSQGSHFFQNLTAFRVAYLNIAPHHKDGTYDLAYLDAQPAIYEDKLLRHIRFDRPLEVMVDGRRRNEKVNAVVLRPNG